MKHLSSLLSILVLFLIPFTSIGQAYTVTVAEHAVDIVEGHTTYRLYVDMVNPEDKLSSISEEGIHRSFSQQQMGFTTMNLAEL